MGVNLNLHYCHGEVDSISFFVENGHCICDEVYADRMNEMTCCFDKNYKFDLDEDQIFTPFLNFNFDIQEFFENPFLSFDFRTLAHQNIQLEAFNLPPPKILQDIPIRILHSVFRL